MGTIEKIKMPSNAVTARLTAIGRKVDKYYKYYKYCRGSGGLLDAAAMPYYHSFNRKEKRGESMNHYYLTEKERKNNAGLNDPQEFYKLDPETQDHLLNWINLNLTERKGFNYMFNSYSLKHLLPFYVTNGALKGAMLQTDFRVVDKTKLNWNFNINIRKVRT